MSLPAASSPEDLDLAGLLEELFRRLREVCPDCAAEVPDCDEQELARRVLAAVADPDSPTGLAPDQLYQAETAVSDLLASDDREALLGCNPRFESPLPARLLIRKARAFSETRFRQAVEVARLAVAAAERINLYLWGRDYARATLLQARCTLVETRRSHGKLDEAWRGVAELLETLHPSVSLRIRGDVYLLAGRIRREQGELADAAALLFVAREVYESLQDEPRLGRTLLQLGDVYREHGQVDLAVEAARRAASVLKPDDDPKAHASARHNLALYLCDAGRPAEAELELEASRKLQTSASTAMRLRSLWLEGRIREQLGDLEEAERLYRQAQEGFVDGDHPVEAALVALDLASLLVGLERFAETREVSAWLGVLFRRNDFPLKMLTALLALREAVQASPPSQSQLFRCLASLRSLLRREQRS